MGDPTKDQLEAAEIVSQSWEQAFEKDLDPQLIASTNLTAAFSHLVKITDRDTAIRIAKRLIVAIQDGKFG